MKSVIALSQIDRIEIYQNTKRYYKEKIKALTGCDYIMNGAFFSGSYNPLQTLKVDGKLIVKDSKYRYLGYGWNNVNDIMLTKYYENFNNYICCINGLQDGENRTMYYNPDVAGRRPRTAMGLTKDSLVLYCDKSAKTPEQVRDIMKSMGCESMVCLDGGGSTQGNFNGMRVDSCENNGNGRICYSYILVYLKKNSNVKPIEKPINSCSYAEPVYLVRYGSKGDSAKWVQLYLTKNGYNIEVDGVFGRMSVAALKDFQQKSGLVADGLCGKQTREALKKGV